MDGQQDALNQLYQIYFVRDSTVHRWVYQRAYWIPAGEKEDVLNDIYMAVIQSLSNFEFRSSLRTYIDRIAKMKCLDAMPSRLGLSRGKGIRFVDIDQRQTDGEPVVQVEDPSPASRPDNLFESLEEQECVYLLHTALTRYTGPRCRAVLGLYIRELQEELSREEIAGQLGVSVERASQMIYDCLYRLRQRMQKKFRDYRHFSDCVCDRVRKKG
jgi:RNA polymerase sigma factor (sigma-70 family)